MTFLATLQQISDKGELDSKYADIFKELHETYARSLATKKRSIEEVESLFFTFLERVLEELRNPYPFEPYHEMKRSPFDYYQFGIDFFLPLVEKSHLHHTETLDQMESQLKASENVILFANHQTEVDPQLISIALRETHPRLEKEMIFVAGDRVVTDPMAIPFSLGRNLLCIYSKKHIDNPPEKRAEKLQHNQKTMARMRELLSTGGKCIYVAPSGGRDRPDSEGNVNVAEFDPQSIEMFRLMAKKAGVKTHFYPLALGTYAILPPPDKVERELGERRTIGSADPHFAFCEEVDLEALGAAEKDRHKKRSIVAKALWDRVEAAYREF